MEASKKPLIIGRGVTKIYGEGESAVRAVNGMDFVFYPGEFAVILGPSGAGKSTLLNLLGGMEPCSEGELIVDDADIAKFDKKGLTFYRREKIGFVFQFYNLMPNLTARENIEIAAEMNRSAMSPDEALAKVGLTERASFFPALLSGGEMQRVSLARAIAKDPVLFLCDEPTGALDVESAKQVITLLLQQAHENGKTVLVVSHNSAFGEIADHLLRIRDGQIVSDTRNDNPKSVEEIEW